MTPPDRPTPPLELLQAIAALDSALAKQDPLEDPLVLWRVWDQDVDRIPGGPLRVGDTLQDLGFCDCTLYQGHAMTQAEPGRAIVRLLLPPGVRIMPLWYSAGDAVKGIVFLGRGTRFRVEAIDRVEGWPSPVVTALVLLPDEPEPEPTPDIALSLPRDTEPVPEQIARVVWAADEPILHRA
ncbi:hypothetical protein [Patulibacter americanus]|uniref:hypothetical protein n=1 Tax=Patulibacter americanus TaxID=588672 RepID=UPI0003B793F8|nr:hypothetical protein [Patulibacter americanus]